MDWASNQKQSWEWQRIAFNGKKKMLSLPSVQTMHISEKLSLVLSPPHSSNLNGRGMVTVLSLIPPPSCVLMPKFHWLLRKPKSLKGQHVLYKHTLLQRRTNAVLCNSKMSLLCQNIISYSNLTNLVNVQRDKKTCCWKHLLGVIYNWSQFFWGSCYLCWASPDWILIVMSKGVCNRIAGKSDFKNIDPICWDQAIQYSLVRL